MIHLVFCDAQFMFICFGWWKKRFDRKQRLKPSANGGVGLGQRLSTPAWLPKSSQTGLGGMPAACVRCLLHPSWPLLMWSHNAPLGSDGLSLLPKISICHLKLTVYPSTHPFAPSANHLSRQLTICPSRWATSGLSHGLPRFNFGGRKGVMWKYGVH